MWRVVINLVFATVFVGCAGAKLPQSEDWGGSPADGLTIPRPEAMDLRGRDKTGGKPDLPRSDAGATPDRALPDLSKIDKFQQKFDFFKPDKPKPDLFKPDKPKPDLPPVCPPLVFSSGFEANNGGFLPTKDWEWGQMSWQPGPNCGSTQVKQPPGAHAGVRMWGTRLNDCYSPLDNAADACNNQNLTDDSILEKGLTLPAACKIITLEYWEWSDFMQGFDWSEVRVVQGGSSSVLHQDCTSGTPQAQWIQKKLDLSAYAGKTISLQFHFMATSVVNYSGWYIDDVKITAQ